MHFHYIVFIMVLKSIFLLASILTLIKSKAVDTFKALDSPCGLENFVLERPIYRILSFMHPTNYFT